MKLIKCVQGTGAWFQARCGRVTASEVADAVSVLTRKSKDKQPGEETAKRASYKAEIICEILTGKVDMNGFLSKYMKEGTEREPAARSEYEILTGQVVDQIGFALHPTIERAGGSPDGLVGADGLIEIKCPKTETHINYILADQVPAVYKPQMYWNMVCCERAWCDFVSFDPRLPDVLQLFVKRLPRDEQKIAELEEGVRQFLAEVDQTIALLREKVGAFSVPQPKKEQTADEMLREVMDELSGDLIP